MAAISQDDRAYRRGVVFGFTVAEVVLLLVFCLLLLFVPLLLGENKKAAKGAAGGAPFVVLPPTEGSASAVRPAQKAASSKDAMPKADEAAKPAEPPLVDPTNNLPATVAEPLPEGWIRVAPNAANSNMARDGSRQPSPAADVPFEALPLASVCDRLGVAAADCTAIAASEKLRALGRHNWPPIIKLKEADGFYFVVGQARISDEFRAQLTKDVVPRILQLVAQYRTDVIEIVGHTDEQPIMGGATNLDTLSVDVISKSEAAARLSAADNAGLGFARALAVVQLLRADARLKGLTILPLSAAQMIDVDGKLSTGRQGGDVKERRRIELRVRQSGTDDEAWSRR